MAARQFPLDGAFDDLRRIVERVQGEFRLLLDQLQVLTDSAQIASDELRNVRAITSGASAGGASRQRSGQGLSAEAKQAKDDAKKLREEIKKAELESRTIVDAFSKVRESARTTVELLRRWNMPQRAKQAEKIADALEAVEVASKTIYGTWKLMSAAMLPAAAAVAVTTGAVVALQTAVNSLTGSTLTVKETIVAFALSGQQALLGLKKTYMEVAYAISGDDTGFAASMAEVNDEIRQTEGALKALFEKANERPKQESQGFLKDTYNSVREFGDEVEAVLRKVLGFFDVTQERSKETANEVKRALTPFQQFQADLGQMGNLVQGTYDTILNGVNQLSSTISGALLDAFLNPQADIRESFAQLFRSLAQQLLQLLIRAAIVRAVSGIAGSFAGGGEVGDPWGADSRGYAKGGKVRPGGSPSLQHLTPRAKAYAGGGFERPSWIPSSDTVPAWLTPGEFVNPVPTVKALGVDFFEALRSMRVDPGIMRAAAGLGPRGGGTSLPRGGFNTGGPVSPLSGAANAASPAVAIMVPDEQTAARLFAQGGPAMNRWLRRNRSEVRGILGV